MAVEEQLLYNSETAVQTARIRSGQRLTIPNRKVTKLGFWLRKRNNPTGDVAFEIRKVSNNDLIVSKVWGDASGLQDPVNYEEVTFDTPATINEEVRICIYYPFGDLTDNIRMNYQNTDVKGSEVYTYGGWEDWPDHDGAYRYTYEEEKPAAGGGPAALVAAGII